MDLSIEQLIQNAERCFRLAAQCTDLVITGRLLELATEYRDRALALGADPRMLPQPRGYHDPAPDGSPGPETER